MLKAIFIEDKGTYLIKLSGGEYQIDGKNVLVKGYNGTDTEMTKVDDIRTVSTRTVISHYEHVDGEKYTPSQYASVYDELTSKGSYDEDEGWSFDDVEDQVNHIRFKRSWKRCTKSVTTISEPVEVAIEKSRIDTGCKWVQPLWLVGSDITDPLCIYSRRSAMIFVVKETFADLGMVHDGDCHYSKTNEKKIYGYRDENSLRFWTAFNTFAFNDKHWAVISGDAIKGRMDELVARFKEDRLHMRQELIARFKSHFGSISESDAVNILKNLRGDLSHILGKVQSLKVFVKDRSSHRSTCKSLSDLQSKLDAALSPEIE